MNHVPRTGKLATLGLVALAMLAACVAGGGYDGEVDVGYVGGYYEPCCYDYGGWGGGYRVGPPRGGDRGPHDGGGRGPPSIPHGSRGGGGDHGGGGGHGDGGGHGGGGGHGH